MNKLTADNIVTRDQLKEQADMVAFNEVRDNKAKAFNISMEKIRAARAAYKKVIETTKAVDGLMHDFYIADKTTKEQIYRLMGTAYREFLITSKDFVDNFRHFEIAYIAQLKHEQGETENGNSSNSETSEPA